MNSGDSKTSDPHRLLLNLSVKIILKRSDKYVLSSTLVLTIHGKIKKSHTKIINLKYHLRHGTNSLNYLMDYILCQVLKIILNIF